MNVVTAYGPAEVAGWLDVTPAAVSNWRWRYGYWPVPPAVHVISGTVTFYGWFPEQKAAWLEWFRMYRAGDVP